MLWRLLARVAGFLALFALIFALGWLHAQSSICN